MAAREISGKSKRPAKVKSSKPGKTATTRATASRELQPARMTAQAEACGSDAEGACGPVEAELPVWLVRSAVYRRVPLAERTKLDRAIIFRPQGLATIEAITSHFGLAEKYGVSVAEVAAYADKVEQLVRPEVTSQVLAGILGCLPKAYRRQIVAGSEVLLVSRLLQAINTKDTGLTVAEMAKLASVLLSLARRSGQAGIGRGHCGKETDRTDSEPNAGGQDPIKLADSVRLLYGLELQQGNTEHGPNSGPQTP